MAGIAGPIRNSESQDSSWSSFEKWDSMSPEEHFDKLININIKGAFFTVQKGLPFLNDGGSIILTGSVASVKGTAAFGVYAASKAAIRSFVRTWTTDLKDRHTGRMLLALVQSVRR